MLNLGEREGETRRNTSVLPVRMMGSVMGLQTVSQDHLRVSDRGREKGVRATSVLVDLSRETCLLRKKNTEWLYIL